MTRVVPLFIALVFAVGFGELPTTWAQTKDASKKDASKKEATASTEKKAPELEPVLSKGITQKRVRLDINTASLAELQALPGMNEEYAKKIVENRPYKFKDDLLKKKIIPEDAYDRIRIEVTVKKDEARMAAIKAQKGVDLNFASLADLQTLPGMTADLAQKIVKNRPYNRKNELLELKIVSQEMYDTIREYIIVKRGVDVNTASLAELRTLPGVTAVYAKRIVDNRPYKKKVELVERRIIPQDLYDTIEYDISTKTLH